MKPTSHTSRRISCCTAAVMLLGLLTCPVLVQAHEEIPGGGAQTYTRILTSKTDKTDKYQLDLMYSPSSPTAGEPANMGIGLKRLLAKPDPLLGSEVPVTEPPDVVLLDLKTKKVVVEHLSLTSEGAAGDFEINGYKFPQSGSFLLHVVVHTPAGEALTEDIPITVQANAGALFRFWVNVALVILILGLTGMQLWKVRARGGETSRMLKPAAIGLVSLVVIVFAMDRFILGPVLEFRKPKVAPPPAGTVTTNEDGSYTIPAPVQQQLGISLVEAKPVPMGEIVTAYGTVESRPDLTAVVQGPLWGRIDFPKTGPLAVGDRVKRGQQLADIVLELSAIERGLMQAKDVDIKGALKRGTERMESARLQYERAKELHAKNPEYEADEKWAKELYDQAKADYDEYVKEDRAYSGPGGTMQFRDPRHIPVVSPINGVISTIDFIPGELNPTATYRNLFTIVDLSKVWVRAQVVLPDVTKLKEGESVRVFPANEASKPVTGSIRWIGDTIDPLSRTAPVLVDVSNEGGTFALGSFARMEFSQPEKVLAVPDEAVVDEGTARWVYVERKEGTFAPVQVDLGIRENGWWQVNAGLMEGDQVVAKGAAVLGSMPQPEASATASTPPAAAPSSSPETVAASAEAPAATPDPPDKP
jgi:membrane fusion protein, heavy metal efflux system